MCWLSYNNTPIIAKEDTTVYKYLKEKEILFSILNYYSPFVGNFRYKKDKLYDLEELHYKKRGSNGKYVYIREVGFHSYMKKPDVPYYILPSNAVLTECIIPKGATYYVNEEGEVVSNQIIFKRII